MERARKRETPAFSPEENFRLISGSIVFTFKTNVNCSEIKFIRIDLKIYTSEGTKNRNTFVGWVLEGANILRFSFRIFKGMLKI